MATEKFIVELDAPEPTRLDALISKGKARAKMILEARILLKADAAEGGPGWLDAAIVAALDTNPTMVRRARRDAHATLTAEVGAWCKRRNTHNAKANWHFTTVDARVKGWCSRPNSRR